MQGKVSGKYLYSTTNSNFDHNLQEYHNNYSQEHRSLKQNMFVDEGK